MNNKEQITAYVTKYALTKGITEQKGEISSYDTFGYKVNGWYSSVIKNDYSLTLEDAKKQAEQKRLKKIASLEKQIQKLKKLSF